MSRRTSDRGRLRLTLCDRGWRLEAGTKTIATQDLAPDHDLQTLIDALEALAMSPAPRNGWLDVGVCDRWVQSFDVEPAGGVRSLSELRQLAHLRRHALFGGRDAACSLVADWQGRERFVAAALPDSLMQALHAICRRHGWRLRSVRPRWTSALEQPAPPDAAGCAAVIDGRVVTLVHRVAGRAAWVRTQTLPQPASQDDARRLLDRSVLAVPGLPSQMLVHATDAAVPAGTLRARQFDFARSHSPWRRPSNRALAALSGVVVAVLAALVMESREWHALGEQQRALVAGIDANAASLRLVRPAKSSQTRPEQIGSARLLAARLDAPWMKWLRSFEVSAHPDTTLLALDIDGPTARIRGVALARTPKAMLEHVDRLREQHGLGEPRLLRHDTAEKLPGQPLRFEFTNEPAVAGDASSGATRR